MLDRWLACGVVSKTRFLLAAFFGQEMLGLLAIFFAAWNLFPGVSGTPLGQTLFASLCDPRLLEKGRGRHCLGSSDVRRDSQGQPLFFCLVRGGLC